MEARARAERWRRPQGCCVRRGRARHNARVLGEREGRAAAAEAADHDSPGCGFARVAALAEGLPDADQRGVADVHAGEPSASGLNSAPSRRAEFVTIGMALDSSPRCSPDY